MWRRREITMNEVYNRITRLNKNLIYSYQIVFNLIRSEASLDLVLYARRCRQKRTNSFKSLLIDTGFL